MRVSESLKQLDLSLVAVAGPFGAYVPAKRVGNLVFVAGQLPVREATLIATGQVPSRCSVDLAREAARQCVINAVAAVQVLPGGVDQLTGVARVGAFISSDTDFTEQPKVADIVSGRTCDQHVVEPREETVGVGALEVGPGGKTQLCRAS